MRRREFVRKCVLGGGSVLAAPMVNFGRCRLYAGSERQYSVRTVDLVGRSLVVDMLGLLTLNWERLGQWHADPSTFRAEDFAVLKRSGISVFHPAVDLNCADEHAKTRWLFEQWNGFLQAHPDKFQRISCCADLAHAKAAGRVGIVVGAQNSGHFRSAADVAFFYGLGQRISQLTYNGPNRIGSGCGERQDRGLTGFGASIVGAMNASKMMIDVSHAGERTTLDTFEASRHPVLVTHSNCKALSNHPRCKPDAAIRAMAKGGGVMGITSIRTFVRQSRSVTVEDAIDHFDHVARLVGVEHAGLGSDMDLEGRPPYAIHGLDHPLRVFELTEGLVRRGYSDASITAILGGNFQRVLSAIC